jgi:hypothetical protein
MKKQTFRQVEAQVMGFAQEKPIPFIVIVLVVIVVSSWILSSLQILPEFPKEQKARGVVAEKGDSYDWVGMQVVPLSRSIRKEFKIPGGVKGMFVLDEGKGAAKKYGVKTGDTIVSINRKSVPSARAFIEVANSVQYYDGILLDISRGKSTLYVTIPFEYQYGPMYGPNKRSWQMGSPLWGQALPYGPMMNGGNSNRER